MPRKRSGDDLLLKAADRERKIIASELHDTLCQSLAGLALRTGVAIRRSRSGKRVTIRELEAIERHLNHAMDQCRSLTAFDVIEAQPDRFPAKSREFIQLFAAEIECKLQFDPQVRFHSGKIAHFCYRLIREVVGACARCHPPPRLEIILGQTSSYLFLQINCAGWDSKAWRLLLTADTFLPQFCKVLGGIWKIEGLTLRCLFAKHSFKE